MAGMRRVRIFDCLLRVRDEPEPTPSGALAAVPPLLCIHGAGMSSVVFMDLLRRVAPGRRVVAPDLPGHGQSQRREGLVSVAGYRDTLWALCNVLSLSRVVLIGHSMGAAIALSMALAAPDRVAGLVLLNGGAQLDVPDEVMALLRDSLATAVVEVAEDAHVFVDRMPAAFAELVFSPATSADLRQRWQAMLWSADAATLHADFDACRRLDLRAEVQRAQPSWRIPTLCLSGSEDLLVPASQVAQTAAMLPGAAHHILDRSGHLSHIEQAAVFFPMLEVFLREKRSGIHILP